MIFFGPGYQWMKTKTTRSSLHVLVLHTSQECDSIPCSFGLVRLISRTFSANEQYFSLTPNQLTVLSAMAYQPNKPKRTGRIAPCSVGKLMLHYALQIRKLTVTTSELQFLLNKLTVHTCKYSLSFNAHNMQVFWSRQRWYDSTR